MSIKIATGGYKEVPPDWMPAAQVRHFIFEDPGVVWLKFHGQQHGFARNSSAYEFIDFIGEKSRQFEQKWVKELASHAVTVCTAAYEVYSADKVRETFDHMQRGIPVIFQPALWWAPECIYGVPDLLIHTSWLQDNFPDILSGFKSQTIAPILEGTGLNGHYIVFDLKFTSKLEDSQKRKDLKSYAFQVRIYSYILGNLQGLMPQKAFLITRDRVFGPLPININSILGQPLDVDLAEIRDNFVEIKLNGAKYTPWNDDIVACNLKNQDDVWRTAKSVIAKEKIPGRDSSLLYQITDNLKRELAALGYPNLDSMLTESPHEIPFERCKGLGPAKSKNIRAILKANCTGSAMHPPHEFTPPLKNFEFYVDFEYFNNLNVDFECQWPTLDGCEIIFMVGVGWEDEGRWCHKTFVAASEDQNQERQVLEDFLEFLHIKTDGALTDPDSTVLYHWTSAEVWQTSRASDRHQLQAGHHLRRLPWHDLQKVFLNAPCAIPGAWAYGLKEVSKALGKLNPELEVQWPGDLDEGLNAMVMGWKAYQAKSALESEEMFILTQYLEADCRALCNILKWMRS